MSDFTDDIDGYDIPSEEDFFGMVQLLENGKIVDKYFCRKCRSVNVKESKKGNMYCGDICWKSKI